MTRIDDMLAMRYKGMTLQVIGAAYGISRQRVRQLIGNTGRTFRSEVLISRVEEDPSANPEDICDEMGMDRRSLYRLGIPIPRHEAAGGMLRKGQLGELIVSGKLSYMGIENELMPNRNPYSILTASGIRVDVRTAYHYVKAPSIVGKSNTHMYKFRVWRKGREHDFADFIVCYIYPLHKSYVIPVSYVHGSENIAISYPILRNEVSKWARWEENFDLLKP